MPVGIVLRASGLLARAVGGPRGCDKGIRSRPAYGLRRYWGSIGGGSLPRDFRLWRRRRGFWGSIGVMPVRCWMCLFRNRCAFSLPFPRPAGILLPLRRCVFLPLGWRGGGWWAISRRGDRRECRLMPLRCGRRSRAFAGSGLYQTLEKSRRRGRRRRRNIGMPVLFFLFFFESCLSPIKRMFWKRVSYLFKKGPCWTALHWSPVSHYGQRPSQMTVDDFGWAASNNLVNLVVNLVFILPPQVLISSGSNNLPRYITTGWWRREPRLDCLHPCVLSSLLILVKP